MALNRVKPGHVKYLASVVSLIFLLKTLIKNTITFLTSNSLNIAELVENELMKRISKKLYQYSFFIQFMVAYCKDIKRL